MPLLRPPLSKAAFLQQAHNQDHQILRILGFFLAWLFGGFLIGGQLYFITMDLSESVTKNLPSLAHSFFPNPEIATILQDMRPDLGLIGEARHLFLTRTIWIGFLPALPLCGRIIMKRPAKSWLTTAPRFRWPLLGFGFLTLFLPMFCLFIFDGLIHGFPASAPLLQADQPWHHRLVYLVITGLTLLAAAASEELVIRGWLIQQIGAVARNPLLILSLSAFVFVLIHLEADPLRNLVLYVSGLGLGFIALRLGGLEFGIGIHCANNVLIAWLSNSFSRGQLPKPMYPGDLIVAFGFIIFQLAIAEIILYSIHPKSGNRFFAKGMEK